MLNIVMSIAVYSIYDGEKWMKSSKSRNKKNGAQYIII